MIHCPGNLASVSKHSSSDSNTNKNCSMNMANIFEFLSKDGNITPEKARKLRQMQFHDKTAYVWMGILPLNKARKSRQMQFRDKTAYVWGLRYRWDPSLSRNPVPRFPHFMPPCSPYECQNGPQKTVNLREGPRNILWRLLYNIKRNSGYQKRKNDFEKT